MLTLTPEPIESARKTKAAEPRFPEHNYENILGPCYVDMQAYIDRIDPETFSVLQLELGSRAATHLIIDTQMFKTEQALVEHDGWWGNAQV